MRIADFVITATVVAGLSAPATAQEGSSSAATQPATQAAAANPVASRTFDPNSSHWIASAFVGSNFSSNRNDVFGVETNNDHTTSINFGGQVGYLWRGYVGAEFLADFSPSFEMTNVLFENNPQVNSYMFNAIGATHMGSNQQFTPYVSGGFGAIALRSDIFVIDPTTVAAANISAIGTTSANGSRFGGDIGAGVMGFAGNWGFRGDVRYYQTSTNNNIDLNDIGNGNLFTQSVLSDLSFWKANVGVAFRW
jgi:hypothetical protein